MADWDILVGHGVAVPRFILNTNGAAVLVDHSYKSFLEDVVSHPGVEIRLRNLSKPWLFLTFEAYLLVAAGLSALAGILEIMVEEEHEIYCYFLAFFGLSNGFDVGQLHHGIRVAGMLYWLPFLVLLCQQLSPLYPTILILDPIG